MIRIALADDQELMREGLAMILGAQADLEVVGQAADGAEVVRLTAETRPDVVLMDIRMPRLDGLAATRRIVASGSPSRVLVLTTYDTDEHVYEALAAGASGFLLKDAARAPSSRPYGRCAPVTSSSPRPPREGWSSGCVPGGPLRRPRRCRR